MTERTLTLLDRPAVRWILGIIFVSVVAISGFQYTVNSLMASVAGITSDVEEIKPEVLLNTDHRLSVSVHMPLEEKIELFVTRKEYDKGWNENALMMREMRSDIKLLLRKVK